MLGDEDVPQRQQVTILRMAARGSPRFFGAGTRSGVVGRTGRARVGPPSARGSGDHRCRGMVRSRPNFLAPPGSSRVLLGPAGSFWELLGTPGTWRSRGLFVRAGGCGRAGYPVGVVWAAMSVGLFSSTASAMSRRPSRYSPGGGAKAHRRWVGWAVSDGRWWGLVVGSPFGLLDGGQWVPSSAEGS